MIRISTIVILILTGIIFLPFCTPEDNLEETYWHTFLGSGDVELGYAITRDNLGNLYVTGYSRATWGSPINGYNGGWEVFLACLDQSGNLVWNTFLGCPDNDMAHNIALDRDGKIYLSGYSKGTWGTPIKGYSGGTMDGFVACLDSTGNLLWNTFLGSGGVTGVYGIVPDSSGKVFLVGYNTASWGKPILAYNSQEDGFVACLNSSGQLLWNTFLGSSKGDLGIEIELDNSGKIYVVGQSESTWGSPVNAHNNDEDVFVACLSANGNLLWNTFLGTNQEDQARDITLDSSGNIYVTGIDNANSGSDNALVAGLNNSGQLLWKTILGSSARDMGQDIKVGPKGNLFIAGSSKASWGSPVDPFNGDRDGFTACLDTSGNLLWNTFFGSTASDHASGIILDSSGNFYIIGDSGAQWGSPVNAHSGLSDIFVLKDRVDH